MPITGLGTPPPGLRPPPLPVDGDDAPLPEFVLGLADPVALAMSGPEAPLAVPRQPSAAPDPVPPSWFPPAAVGRIRIPPGGCGGFAVTAWPSRGAPASLPPVGCR